MLEVLPIAGPSFCETMFDCCRFGFTTIDGLSNASQNIDNRVKLLDDIVRVYLDMFLAVHALAGADPKEEFQVRVFDGISCIDCCMF